MWEINEVREIDGIGKVKCTKGECISCVFQMKAHCLNPENVCERPSRPDKTNVHYEKVEE